MIIANNSPAQSGRCIRCIVAPAVLGLLVLAGGCASRPALQRPVAASLPSPVEPPAQSPVVPAVVDVAPNGHTGKPRIDDEPVTGSLLSRAYGRSALPLTIIDAEPLRQQGITTSARAINQIPQSSGY